jgi:hypothetical protein
MQSSVASASATASCVWAVDEFCVFIPKAGRAEIGISQIVFTASLDDLITNGVGGANFARIDKSFVDTYQRADKPGNTNFQQSTMGHRGRSHRSRYRSRSVVCAW